MRSLPEPDPGRPDTRSATRYLIWLVRMQWTSMTLGAFWGVVWMVSQALMPAAIGKTIDAGVTAKDTAELWRWSAVVFGLGCVTGVAGILRHRCAVTNWLTAAYRTVQLTARQATELGATLPGRIATGDVVAIGTADTSSIGGTMDVSARFAGAVVSIVLVSILLLSTEVRIGLTVLIGVPLIMGLVGPLLKPMHRRQSEVRALQGKLTGRANDIVAGLRVLRGIGGEPEFAERYREQSQQLRFAGVRVARVESVLESAQVLLPGLFVVGVTWLAARLAVSHEITTGQLVAFYGYAAFLVLPLRTITEAWGKVLRAHVAATKVVRVLALTHPLADAAGSPTDTAADAGTGVLLDEHSGLRLKPGSFTAVAAADPAEAIELADRLGRYRAADGVTLDGVPLEAMPLDRLRQRVLVADNDARLFAGRLAEGLAGSPTDTAADAGTGVLLDEHSGLRLKPGSFTAVAAADPAEAIELADRLGRYRAADGVTLDGVPLEAMPLDRLRQRVLVADNDARLFAGRLAEGLAGSGGGSSAGHSSNEGHSSSPGHGSGDVHGTITAALHTAAAEDIVEALPDGLDSAVTERGRSFSGGQQQRLRLARALLADPEVLLLVEPTSAVDAHTEARIAERLAQARTGRTTVVFTTSPLMLDRAERVVFLAGGRAAAEGRHRELLATVPAYRATVTREED